MTTKLQSCFQKVLRQQQSYEEIAKYCVDSTVGSEYETSKAIDSFFSNSNFKGKVIAFLITCQILQLSKEKGCSKGFVKCLAQKIKFFLQSFAIDTISKNVANAISSKLAILKEMDIFYSAYYEKLENLMKKIRQNSKSTADEEIDLSSMIKNFSFKKYSRTFLMDYQLISSDPNLKQIYEAIQSHSASMYQTDDPLSSQKEPNQMTTDLSQQLQRKEEALLVCQKAALKLRSLMKQELQNFKELMRKAE